MKTSLLFGATLAVVGAAMVSVSAQTPEYVAHVNSFASPNGGIAKSTRDRNGESIRHSISNYPRRDDPEFADEPRAWRKGQTGDNPFTQRRSPT